MDVDQQIQNDLDDELDGHERVRVEHTLTCAPCIRYFIYYHYRILTSNLSLFPFLNLPCLTLSHLPFSSCLFLPFLFYHITSNHIVSYHIRCRAVLRAVRKQASDHQFVCPITAARESQKTSSPRCSGLMLM